MKSACEMGQLLFLDTGLVVRGTRWACLSPLDMVNPTRGFVGSEYG